MENSIGVITAICPYVGYETAANIAEALHRPPGQRPDPGKGLMDEEQLNTVLDPYTMTEPGILGKIRWSSCGVNEKRAYKKYHLDNQSGTPVYFQDWCSLFYMV